MTLVGDCRRPGLEPTRPSAVTAPICDASTVLPNDGGVPHRVRCVLAEEHDGSHTSMWMRQPNGDSVRIVWERRP